VVNIILLLIWEIDFISVLFQKFLENLLECDTFFRTQSVRLSHFMFLESLELLQSVLLYKSIVDDNKRLLQLPFQ